jgi:hypothetical protein
MSSAEEFQSYSTLPLYRMTDWCNRVWKLSSIFYESIPANKAGTFFSHLQEMFEVHEPRELLVDIGVNTCIRAIGYYCRILCQLEGYTKPEFNDSIRSLISTNYGREKVYGAIHRIKRCFIFWGSWEAVAFLDRKVFSSLLTIALALNVTGIFYALFLA